METDAGCPLPAFFSSDCSLFADAQPFAVGQVKVNGQVWSAVGTRPETTIEQGTEVKIHAVEGVKLVVVPMKKD